MEHIMDHFDPELATWQELTVEQRAEIFHTHSMRLTDFDSSLDFVAYLSKLRWSLDIRPPEERLKLMEDNILSITGTWFGYDDTNTLVMDPPVMQRISEEDLENHDENLHSAVLNVKVSLFVARMLAKLLFKHASCQYATAKAHPPESMIGKMCSEEADYAKQAADGIQKIVDKYEEENDIK